MAVWLVLPRPAESLQSGAGFSGKKVGLLKSKEWLQCHKVSSQQKRQSRLCYKDKEQNHQYRLPDHEMGDSHGERGPHLGDKEMAERVHGVEGAAC